MIDSIEISIDDWGDGVPLLAFLQEREIDARPALPPQHGIVVDPGPDDPAAIEVYVALHSWLELHAGTDLSVTVDGRPYVLHGPSAEVVV
jgi:hypothetical protein